MIKHFFCLLQVKTGSSPQSATFIFGNEDHTLGNALRYILMERPETDFCGYRHNTIKKCFTNTPRYNVYNIGTACHIHMNQK